jgi:hypothetical protein
MRGIELPEPRAGEHLEKGRSQQDREAENFNRRRGEGERGSASFAERINTNDSPHR